MSDARDVQFVTFGLTERERARMQGLAARLGYRDLAPLVADVFRVELEQFDHAFVPASGYERFLNAKGRVRAKRH